MAEPEQKTETNQENRITSEPEGTEQELLESLRRERASFLNYKRRVEQEREADRERAHGDVLLRLLPVLDELERALAHRPRELESHPWVQGVSLIHRRLTDTLRDLGVERIGTEGEPFNPAHHEAVLYEGRPDTDERRVNEVIRPGYRSGERLLRPAQVSVVGPPETATETAPEERDPSPQAASSPARDT